ncbi:unnamed protein product [Pedinophyceae sp. YPF-701]|nr:unnamed protein product [Pedinophyceae sp. YPF-701]
MAADSDVREVANNVAVLEDGDGRKVYVLGISHVSKVSCDHIEALIRAVRPDAVMLELCKNRTTLMVEPDVTGAAPDQLWHAPAVSISGLPTGAGWPTEQELLAALSTKPFAPVTRATMDADAAALRATGLFHDVRVRAGPPPPGSAPQLLCTGAAKDPAPVLPMGAVEFVAQAVASPPEDFTAPSPKPPRYPVAPEGTRPWRLDERGGGVRPEDTPPAWSEALAGKLTRAFAEKQAEAGRVVGIQPGAAWRVAAAAAAQNGARLVLLGDLPTSVTKRELTTALSSAMTSKVVAAGAIVAAGAAAASALPGGGVAGQVATVAAAVAAGGALVAAPLLGPLNEVGEFSRMSGPEIEKAVAVGSPGLAGKREMTKLWGEDALIDWPGAQGPIIDARDRHMTEVLRGVVAGKGAAPAFVVGRGDGSAGALMRYMMPEGASDKETCPGGFGEGCYTVPGDVRTVVAVVGTAHVGGMVRAWQDAGTGS